MALSRRSLMPNTIAPSSFPVRPVMESLDSSESAFSAYSLAWCCSSRGDVPDGAVPRGVDSVAEERLDAMGG